MGEKNDGLDYFKVEQTGLHCVADEAVGALKDYIVIARTSDLGCHRKHGGEQ
jgi:hypothetical protein